MSGSRAEWWGRPSQRGLERTVGWLGVAVLVALAGAFLLFSAYGRHQAHERAEAEAVAATRLIAENASRFFDAVDYALDDAIENIGLTPWDQVGQSRPLWQRLASKMRHFPYVEALWFHDAAGKLWLGTPVFPAPDDLNASDRDYFKAHIQSGDPTAPYVSGPVVGRLSERTTFLVSRRLSDTAGNLRGVASASIDPAYFEQFFGAVDLSDNSTITLFRASDLTVLVRNPQDALPLPQPLPDHLRAALDGRPVAAVVDDGHHLAAIRRLQPWPLYVAVDIDPTVVNDAWRDSLRPYAWVMLLAVLALILFIVFAFRQARQADLMVAELEARVDERTSSLREALGQKDMLMREINHRVKNSLQMVASFLTMQGMTSGDQAVRDNLDEAGRRVRAISDAHQMLYTQDDVTSIRMDEFLSKLCRDIQQTAMASQGWDLRCEIAPLRLPADTAIAVGLLANEFLTNAAKHAYPGEVPDKPVSLRLAVEEGRVVLEVADAGIGLPVDQIEGKKRSLGMQVIRALSRQVGGTLTVEPRQPGVAFRVAMEA